MNRQSVERQYEEFVPSTRSVRGHQHDTLVVDLPGFKKEQLKVQVTTLRNLRVSGERPLDNNKWSKFRMEFPITSNYQINEISAKFEGGSLYINQPKIITAEDHKPQQEIEQPKEKATKQNEPSKPQTQEEARMQKVASKQKGLEEMASAQQVPPKTEIEKQQMEKTNGVTNSADDLSQNEAETKSSEKKSEDMAGEDGKISGATKEMDKNLGQTAASMTERDKPGVEGLNQGVSRLVTDIKRSRKFLINLVVTVLLVLVVGIYVRNEIRSIGKSNN